MHDGDRLQAANRSARLGTGAGVSNGGAVVQPINARDAEAFTAVDCPAMVASTMASDLVLALACVVGAAWLLGHAEVPRRYAAVGMALMAAAGAIGSLRFGGVGGLVSLHRGVSHLAGAIAPGCFALVALAIAWGASRRFVEIGLAALALAWVVFDPVLDLPIYRTLIGSLAVVVMIGVGARARSGPGLALIGGALILALAGLVIGSEGTIGPLLAVDVFHVALAAAHLLIARGLVGLGLRR